LRTSTTSCRSAADVVVEALLVIDLLGSLHGVAIATRLMDGQARQERTPDRRETRNCSNISSRGLKGRRCGQ
jgi:hypothetical protein